MARLVNEKEYTAKRNEIMDSAWQLIYLKGYEQMSIQHILDDLAISKGAFYHYFSSKANLLEALVERLMDEGVKIMAPIVEDPTLNAIEKFQRYFDTAVSWKTARKAYLLAFIRGWYKDDNVLVRQKAFDQTLQQIGPFFSSIIQQGMQEGVFHVTYPDQAGELLLSLFQAFGNTFPRVFLDLDQERDEQKRCQLREYLVNSLAAYSEAMERILNAPAGSLKMMDPAKLDEWIAKPGIGPKKTGESSPVEVGLAVPQGE